MELCDIYAARGIDPRLCAMSEEIVKGLQGRFRSIDETAEKNQIKALQFGFHLV